MFRALTCPSAGGKIVFTQNLVSWLSVNVCTVHWLRALNQCTVQAFTESDDTRCCVNTIFLLKMGMLMLETCRGNSVTNILLMDKENCALKLVDEIILYYDVRSKKHQTVFLYFVSVYTRSLYTVMENRLAELAHVDGRKWSPGRMLTRRGDQNAHRKIYHQYQLVLIKFHNDESGIIPGPPWSEISMHCLSYDKAVTKTINNRNF